MTTFPENVSTSGRYKAGDNQVAFTKIGDTDVSTIWWKRTGDRGDWFETLTFKDGKATTSVPDVSFTEEDALRGHAAAMSALVLGLTNDDDPEDDNKGDADSAKAEEKAAREALEVQP